MKRYLALLTLIPGLLLATQTPEEIYRTNLKKVYLDLFKTHLRHEDHKSYPLNWLIGKNLLDPWNGEPKLVPFHLRAHLIIKEAFERSAKLYNISPEQFFIDLETLSQQELVKQQQKQSFWSSYIKTSNEIKAAANILKKLREKKKFIEKTLNAHYQIRARFYRNN